MAWQALPAIDPAAPVYDRLSAFCDWLLDVAGGVEMFVADGDGLPLATRGARDEHVAVSAAIDRSMRPILRSLSGDPHVSVVMETGEGELLEVLWVSTPAGRWAVGLVVPEALPRAATQTIRETLRSVCSVNERKIGCLAST